MTIHLRRLTPADAGEYREFRLAALREAPTAFTSSYEEERGKPLSTTVDRLTREIVLGAYGEGALLGVAGLSLPSRGRERHKATLFGMAVAPRAAGRGIGKALVSEILAVAEGVGGLTQVALTVSEGNTRAERLYRSCGFETWGREPRAVLVDGRPIAKLHMLRLLRPAVLVDGRPIAKLHMLRLLRP
ncbi:GNAT family N-acetyltransferase [Bailinhaonella thermotolerans]|uniref:GNAT family N-acetyltransferase n=1 Tax=Bailinhaonella thermotolerans TaxID=1070861 RepID=UPI00192A4A63|nr:GNAT family N-acetyltransferase [Bailinhaonella thermotolerans]